MLFTINEAEQEPIDFIAVRFNRREAERVYGYRNEDVTMCRVDSFDKFCRISKTPTDAFISFLVNKVAYAEGPLLTTNRPMLWPEDLMRTKAGNCVDFGCFMHFFFQKQKIEHALGFTMFAETPTMRPIPGHCFIVFRSNVDHRLWIWNYFANYRGDFNGPFESYEEIEDEAGSYFSILYNSDVLTQTSAGNPNRTSRIAFTGIARENELVVLDRAYAIRSIEDQNVLTSQIPAVQRSRETYLNNGAWVRSGAALRRLWTLIWPNPKPIDVGLMFRRFYQDGR